VGRVRTPGILGLMGNVRQLRELILLLPVSKLCSLQCLLKSVRMKHCAFVVGILALALPFASIVFGKDKPEKGALPLGADEVAIYKALLTKYVSGEPGSLNVSVKTYPLDPEANMNGLKNGGCLKGIELDNLSLVSHTYHELTPDVLPGKNVRLVDPHKQAKVVRGNDPDKTMRKGKSVDSAVNEAFASALFSMSESRLKAMANSSLL